MAGRRETSRHAFDAAVVDSSDACHAEPAMEGGEHPDSVPACSLCRVCSRGSSPSCLNLLISAEPEEGSTKAISAAKKKVPMDLGGVRPLVLAARSRVNADPGRSWSFHKCSFLSLGKDREARRQLALYL